MKVTVLNTSTATAKLFTAVVPQEPKPVEEPRQPNGWKRFWNRFGFYKKDMQTYQNKLNQYNDYVADKAVYDENVKKDRGGSGTNGAETGGTGRHIGRAKKPGACGHAESGKAKRTA